MITLNEIAKKAKVSIMTASRALRKDGSKNVSKETRDKILNIAKTNGYHCLSCFKFKILPITVKIKIVNYKFCCVKCLVKYFKNSAPPKT